jgi:hydrogenase-4 component J
LEPQVVFYQLNRKVVNKQEDIPEDARQVMYYALAIGHHVGVMDCFSELMTIPTGVYERCVARLPGGEARRKLNGVLKWHEIEINRGHADELLPALNGLLSEANEPEAEWVRTMIHCLKEMLAEPALYMMVRMRA